MRVVSRKTILRIAIGLIYLASLILWRGRHDYVLYAGIILMGVGFGPIFPTILGYVGDAFTRLSGTAFSLVLVLALTGNMLLNYMVGLFAERAGLEPLIFIVALSAVAMTIFLATGIHQSEKS